MNTTTTDNAVEELRRLYWLGINTRDMWRHSDNPREQLSAFVIHDSVEQLGRVLLRHLESENTTTVASEFDCSRCGGPNGYAYSGGDLIVCKECV